MARKSDIFETSIIKLILPLGEAKTFIANFFLLHCLSYGLYTLLVSLCKIAPTSYSMKIKSYLIALALVASQSLSAQIVTHSLTAPSSPVVSYVSDETSGVNMRFRSGGTDTDVGQVFTSTGDYSQIQTVTVKISDFSLAANPVFQFDFFSFSGSGDPSPSVNSSATKDAITNYTYNRLWSVTGSMSPADFAAVANNGFITFDISAQNQALVNGTKYGFTVGFASETANVNDRIRINADSTGIYSDGYEIRRDYEFGATRQAGDINIIENAGVSRDLTFYVTAIPEPGAYAAVAGLGLLGWMVLRRKRS